MGLVTLNWPLQLVTLVDFGFTAVVALSGL